MAEWQQQVDRREEVLPRMRTFSSQQVHLLPHRRNLQHRQVRNVHIFLKYITMKLSSAQESVQNLTMIKMGREN